MIQDDPQRKERPADADPEDLRTIFDSIDEHLSFWNVLYNDAVSAQDDWQPVSLDRVSAAADWIQMDSAPLFASAGVGGARGIRYRALNLVIKLFGAPQIRANRQLREFLSELLVVLRARNQEALALHADVEHNTERIRALEAENASLRVELDALAGQVAALRAGLARANEDRPGKK